MNLVLLYLFANSLYVYLDKEDDHTDFIIRSLADQYETLEDAGIEALIRQKIQLADNQPFELSAERMFVNKDKIELFEKEVRKLFEFLRIFKHDLQDIQIDHRDIGNDVYQCSLSIKYSDYAIDAEFESTGIKKLIKLFTYFNKMVNGGIVFIDEMDSNLHDVYLCALLEYLMEYGNGQLCFTTHNIGPMDILKRNKLSIDFLSVNHQIYSWKTSGNYSPSKLYRNGMIEGSPFNVYSIDFIGAFQMEGDD